jgi:hypothetical protein
MLSVFLAFITIFFLASRARALDDRLCDTRGVLPTPAPGVLLTDQEQAGFTRMIAAIDVIEPYPASNLLFLEKHRHYASGNTHGASELHQRSNLNK